VLVLVLVLLQVLVLVEFQAQELLRPVQEPHHLYQVS